MVESGAAQWLLEQGEERLVIISPQVDYNKRSSLSGDAGKQPAERSQQRDESLERTILNMIDDAHMTKMIELIHEIALRSEGLISPEEVHWRVDESICDIAVYIPYEKVIVIRWSIFEGKPTWEQRVILAHEMAHQKHREIRHTYWASLMIAEEIMCDWFICRIGFKDDLQKFRLRYPAYGRRYADLFDDYQDLPKLSETSHQWLFWKRAGLV